MTSGTCRTASPMIPRAAVTALSGRASAQSLSKLSPVRNEPISVTASRMSWTRSCQILGDTDGLPLDARSHRRPETVRGTDVDRAAQDLLEMELEPDQSEI